MFQVSEYSYLSAPHRVRVFFRELSIRINVASGLLTNGHSVETVQLLLGHAELDHVMPYLEVSQKTLRKMFEAVI